MLKINIADVVKVLTVDQHGVCEDGTGRTWVRCSALSFFDEDEQYMVLTAFGATADMILDNHTGNNMRRAFVNGVLEITREKISQKIEFNGVTKTVILPDLRFQLIANSFSFIDKNNWGETAGESIVADDDDEPIDLTAMVVAPKKKEVAATAKRISVDDEEEVVINREKQKTQRTARDKKRPTRK